MLHGRAKETATIDDVLADVRDGRSAALVVRGAPGLGKSALLDYTVTQAVGMRVLRATGIESEAELPFAVLHLLLRPALTRLHELPAPQANALRGALGLADTSGDDRFLIGLAALSLLSELAGDTGLVCIVDDAHWLDGASADALLFAARRLDSEGVALIFAAREEGFPAPGLPELTLDPLSRTASRALLDEHNPGLSTQTTERILTEADGNPLALLQLPGSSTNTPAMAPLPLPGRLQETYYQQITNLPPPTQKLLLIAAAEETGDLTAILKAGAALSIPADATGPAERAQLITVANLTVTFRHPLIRAAVYQGAVFADRCAVHRALAGALTSPQDADRRAWHLAGAATGPDENIAAALETTAGRARQRRGYAAAAAALERAAILTPEPAAKASRLIAAAESAADAARPSAAATLAAQAGQYTEDPVALARIARVHARVDIERGAMKDAHQQLIAAARLITMSDPTTATIMRMEAGRAASWLGDLALAQEASDELEDGPLTPLVNGVRAMAELLAGHPDKAMPALNAVVATYRSGPRDARLFASSIAPLSGDFEAARDIGQVLASECRADGTIRLLPLIHTNIALAEFQLNRFTDATATATEGLRLAMDTDQPLRVAYLRCILASLAAIAGDDDRCRGLVTLIKRDLSTDAIRVVETTTEAALAMIDLGQGRFEAALDRLEAASAGPARYHMNVIYFAADQAEAAFRLGRPDRAEEPAGRFARWADAAGKEWALAVAHRCRAMTSVDAEPHYRAALEAHAVSGRPFELARTELLYGEWLRRGRRAIEARPPLRDALIRFVQCGASRWADRARAELRAAGEASAASVPSVADRVGALTPQELQVVRLAAAGATNRDIAAQLFLSPRTISHHLYRAFPKLGVTTRTALASLDLNLFSNDVV